MRLGSPRRRAGERAAEKFLLPLESVQYTLVTGANIPYQYCRNDGLVAARGSGTDVQGSHPQGGLKGVRPVYWLVTVLKSPRRFLCRFNTDRLRRFATDQTAEHKVPNSPMAVASALYSGSDRTVSARPPAGIAPVAAAALATAAGRACSAAQAPLTTLQH